jgi:hypothetical protein
MLAERTPRGQLSPISAKGLGKKNAPSERFPFNRCSHIEGGEKIPWKRKRKDGSTYTVMIVVGGQRCLKTAETKSPTKGWRCLGHCGSQS